MIRLFTLMMALCLATNVVSREIAGIEMPDSITTANDTSLHLNGAGIRSKWFVDLYVAGLYLTDQQTDAEAILAADAPMAIRLHIISGLITSEKMTEATIEGFDSATGGNTAPLQVEIDLFLSSFVEPIKEGDIFDFIYQPQLGISIIKNGTLKQTMESDADFKKALFGIWISDNPAQKSLKHELLGHKV